MKEIRQKKDKGVSAIIATILLIAITVVLAATLVTILGGFTHGVSNSVVSVSATTQEVQCTSYGPCYIVYFNVTSSSSSVANSSLTVNINGASQGNFGTFLVNHQVSTGTSTHYKNPASLSGGSNFEFSDSSQVSSFELIYDGNVIYNSGTITLS